MEKGAAKPRGRPAVRAAVDVHAEDVVRSECPRLAVVSPQWAKRRAFEVVTIDRMEGDGAGIKSSGDDALLPTTPTCPRCHGTLFSSPPLSSSTPSRPSSPVDSSTSSSRCTAAASPLSSARRFICPCCTATKTPLFRPTEPSLPPAAEIEIRGRYAYGLLAGEKGTHRLVRTNPMKNTGTRETSFAGVEVMPLLEEEDMVAVEVPEADLEITTMRATGAGGQVRG